MQRSLQSEVFGTVSLVHFCSFALSLSLSFSLCSGGQEAGNAQEQASARNRGIRPRGAQERNRGDGGGHGTSPWRLRAQSAGTKLPGLASLISVAIWVCQPHPSVSGMCITAPVGEGAQTCWHSACARPPGYTMFLRILLEAAFSHAAQTASNSVCHVRRPVTAVCYMGVSSSLCGHLVSPNCLLVVS